MLFLIVFFFRGMHVYILSFEHQNEPQKWILKFKMCQLLKVMEGPYYQFYPPGEKIKRPIIKTFNYDNKIGIFPNLNIN